MAIRGGHTPHPEKDCLPVAVAELENVLTDTEKTHGVFTRMNRWNLLEDRQHVNRADGISAPLSVLSITVGGGAGDKTKPGAVPCLAREQ